MEDGGWMPIHIGLPHIYAVKIGSRFPRHPSGRTSGSQGRLCILVADGVPLGLRGQLLLHLVPVSWLLLALLLCGHSNFSEPFSLIFVAFGWYSLDFVAFMLLFRFVSWEEKMVVISE